MRKHIIYPDCDIKFKGHVTWVGKTSIEAKMHMTQVFALPFYTTFSFLVYIKLKKNLFYQYHDGVYTDVLDATFVMVARDPENKRYL